jgi:hypothetical protein
VLAAVLDKLGAGLPEAGVQFQAPELLATLYPFWVQPLNANGLTGGVGTQKFVVVALPLLQLKSMVYIGLANALALAARKTTAADRDKRDNRDFRVMPGLLKVGANICAIGVPKLRCLYSYDCQHGKANYVQLIAHLLPVKFLFSTPAQILSAEHHKGISRSIRGLGRFGSGVAFHIPAGYIPQGKEFSTLQRGEAKTDVFWPERAGQSPIRMVSAVGV